MSDAYLHYYKPMYFYQSALQRNRPHVAALGVVRSVSFLERQIANMNQIKARYQNKYKNAVSQYNKARFRTGKTYWSNRKKHWMKKLSQVNAQIAKLTQYIKIKQAQELQKEGAYTLTSDVALAPLPLDLDVVSFDTEEEFLPEGAGSGVSSGGSAPMSGMGEINPLWIAGGVAAIIVFLVATKKKPARANKIRMGKKRRNKPKPRRNRR